MDPAHWRVHARIARLHTRRGAPARAITGYRLSVAGKHDGVGVRSTLAWLYLRQHRWRAASLEAWGMLEQVPVALWDETRCVGRRIEGAIRRLGEPGVRPRYSPYSTDRSPTRLRASCQVRKRVGYRAATRFAIALSGCPPRIDSRTRCAMRPRSLSVATQGIDDGSRVSRLICARTAWRLDVPKESSVPFTDAEGSPLLLPGSKQKRWQSSQARHMATCESLIGAAKMTLLPRG